MKTKLKKIVFTIAILTGGVASTYLLAQPQVANVFVKLESNDYMAIVSSDGRHITFPGTRYTDKFGFRIEPLDEEGDYRWAGRDLGYWVGGVLKHDPSHTANYKVIYPKITIYAQTTGGIASNDSSVEETLIKSIYLRPTQQESFQKTLNYMTRYKITYKCSEKKVKGEDAYVIEIRVDK